MPARAELDALQNVVPVMQDWGGPIGSGWAVRNPERVAGFVILNTWAFVKEPRIRLPWIYRFLFMGRGGRRRALKRNFPVEAFLLKRGVSSAPSEDVKRAYRAPFPTPAQRVGMAQIPRMIPQTHDTKHPDWATMAAVEDGLADLAHRPALICWAKKDVVFRKPFLDRWVGLFANVDGPHMLPEARHFLQEEAPDAIIDRMEAWTAKLGTSTGARRGGFRGRDRRAGT